MNNIFTTAQVAALASPLTTDHVKSRNQAGRSVSYIEGWHAIAEANRIFGFDAWDRETIGMTMVVQEPREIGQGKAPGWGVSYIAKVRIRVQGVTREGWGTGPGIDKDLGQAHESALKEAETDAMKRALMTFGNPFGLALYDKAKANVQAPAPAAPTPAATKQPATPATPDGEAYLERALGEVRALDTTGKMDAWWERNGVVRREYLANTTGLVTLREAFSAQRRRLAGVVPQQAAE